MSDRLLRIVLLAAAGCLAGCLPAPHLAPPRARLAPAREPAPAGSSRLATAFVHSGSGTTADPWAGWSRALARGATVVFPAGIYAVEHAALDGLDGLTIRCAPGATFRRSAATAAVPLFHAARPLADLAIEGCTFDDGRAAVREPDVLLAGGSARVRIENNAWPDLGRVDNGANAPVRLLARGGPSRDLRIAGNSFHADPVQHAAPNAIVVSGWSDVVIEGNRFTGAGGIKYDKSSAESWDTEDVTIRENTFRNVDQTAIFVRPSRGSVHGIRGVRVERNSGSFEGRMQRAKGLVNIGEGNGRGTADHAVRDVLVAGNVARGYQGLAIVLGDSTGGRVEGARIENNVIDGRDPRRGVLDARSGLIGISIRNRGSRNVAVVGNAVTYTASSCISSSGSDVLVQDNELTYCHQLATVASPDANRSAPVYVAHGRNVEIRGNTIRRPFTADLAASHATGAIVVNKDPAIVGVTIRGNTIVDDRDHDTDGDGRIDDVDGDGRTARSDQRGLAYGIKVGIDATTSPRDVVVEDNTVRHARLARQREFGRKPPRERTERRSNEM